MQKQEITYLNLLWWFTMFNMNNYILKMVFNILVFILSIKDML